MLVMISSFANLLNNTKSTVYVMSVISYNYDNHYDSQFSRVNRIFFFDIGGSIAT